MVEAFEEYCKVSSVCEGEVDASRLQELCQGGISITRGITIIFYGSILALISHSELG